MSQDGDRLPSICQRGVFYRKSSDVPAAGRLSTTNGEFMRAYSAHRELGSDLALEASAASAALLALIDRREYWKGTSSELVAELNSLPSNEEVKRQRGWPKSPQAMGSILKRIAPNLRAVGIRAERGDGRERRTWILEKCGDCSSPSSRMSSQTSVLSSESDIGDTEEPCLSRELSQETLNLKPPLGHGDKRDNHLPEFSETPRLDDETSERAAIVEFDGGLTKDEAERFARKKDVREHCLQ